jgi:hypothetical protein
MKSGGGENRKRVLDDEEEGKQKLVFAEGEEVREDMMLSPDPKPRTKLPNTNATPLPMKQKMVPEGGGGGGIPAPDPMEVAEKTPTKVAGRQEGENLGTDRLDFDEALPPPTPSPCNTSGEGAQGDDTVPN